VLSDEQPLRSRHGLACARAAGVDRLSVSLRGFERVCASVHGWPRADLSVLRTHARMSVVVPHSGDLPAYLMRAVSCGFRPSVVELDCSIS
jgi:hypothetical protein